jgi:hypothetical protein
MRVSIALLFLVLAVPAHSNPSDAPHAGGACVSGFIRWQHTILADGTNYGVGDWKTFGGDLGDDHDEFSSSAAFAARFEPRTSGGHMFKFVGTTGYYRVRALHNETNDDPATLRGLAIANRKINNCTTASETHIISQRRSASTEGTGAEEIAEFLTGDWEVTLEKDECYSFMGRGPNLSRGDNFKSTFIEVIDRTCEKGVPPP